MSQEQQKDSDIPEPKTTITFHAGENKMDVRVSFYPAIEDKTVGADRPDALYAMHVMELMQKDVAMRSENEEDFDDDEEYFEEEETE